MKNLNLLKSTLLLFALVVGSTSLWAADVTGTINFGSGSGSTNIDDASINGNDSQSNSWTITTVGTTSFTPNAAYAQIGSSKKPATSITFTTTLPSSQTIKAFSAKFGGFNSTAGTVTLKVGETNVGTGSLNGANDVIVSATNTTTSGTVLTVTVTGIDKGVKAYYISYTYDDGTAPSVSTPSITPGTNTYTSAQDVEITCETGGAKIYYTMTEDGTTPDDPTESDDEYTGTISVTKNGTKIKAKAFKDGMTASSVATATYTIKPSKPDVSAAGATVTITGNSGLDFYYTIDNSVPTKSSTHYTAPFEPGSDCTIKAIAYDTYDNASDVTSFTFKYMPLNPKNINSGYFVKVTNVSDLEDGDAILIVNEDEFAALGPQSGNNCPEKEVTISSNTISNKGDALKLVLVKKNETIDEVATDVFYFYTGNGYLYAASSSNNHLKEEATPDNYNNARATISITSGNATITFKGTNTHNLVQYNSASSLFSCYASASQSAVQIYKEIAHSESLSPAKTYTTLTSAYNLDFTGIEGLKAYIATSVSDKKVQMTQVNKVPAGTGLVLKATTPGSAVKVPVFDGTSPDDVSSNKMVGSATETTAIAANAGYILIEGVFQPASAGTLPAGKAYLNIAVASAHPLSLDFGDGDVTGIENLTIMPSRKGEGMVYDLQGRRVAQPAKGLYIVNGKKVFVP